MLTVLAEPNIINAVLFDVVPSMSGRHKDDISLATPIMIEAVSGSKLDLVNSK